VTKSKRIILDHLNYLLESQDYDTLVLINLRLSQIMTEVREQIYPEEKMDEEYLDLVEQCETCEGCGRETCEPVFDEENNPWCKQCFVWDEEPTEDLEQFEDDSDE